MGQDLDIYGTVVKRTMMEADYSRDKGFRHDPNTVHHTRKSSRWPSSLAVAAACVTFGGSIPVGYIAGAGINPYHVEDHWVSVPMATLRTLLLTGGVVGAITALYLADKGRKQTIVTGNIIAVAGAVLHVIASLTQCTTLLVTAWLSLGVYLGVCVTLLPLYLVEVAPPYLHSSLGAVFTVGTTLGALLSQIFSLHCALGSGRAHPLLLPVFVVPVLASWFLLSHVPESPLYLHFIKKDSHLAAQELARLSGCDTRTAESQLLQYSGQSADCTWHQLIQQPTLVLLVCVAHLGHAFGGADQVYKLPTAGTGLSEADVVAANYLASVANCIAALVLVPLVSALSWQVLLIVSSLFTALLFIVLATLTVLTEDSDKMEYVTLVILLVQVVMFDIGLRPIPYFLACELFETNASATVTAVGVAVNFAGQLLSDQLSTNFGTALSRVVSALVLALLTIFLLFTPMADSSTDVQAASTVPPKQERRISYTPNPHRLPGDADRYRRKAEERKSSLTI